MNEVATDVLEIMGLKGGYGRVPILHGIDFAVARNEVVGVLGHNGMGKTTLLKTIMGFLPAGAGTIRFRSEDVTRMSPNERAGRGVGYVPQGRGIFPQLTVHDNLRFAWHEYTGASESDALEAVLSEFPRLRALSDRAGEALSGGEQQLLALARCLMGDPDLLLLDEPTEGIQPSIIQEMEKTLLGLRESRGISILLVEQNFDFISDLSDRVLVLERGRITGELKKSDLSDQAKVDQYLGFGAVRSARISDSQHQMPPPGSQMRPNPSITLPDQPAVQNSVTYMTVKRPTVSQMRDMASRFGMSLTDEELREYSEIMEPYIQAYDRLDATPDNLPLVRYPRSPGYFPDLSENPLNAWYVKTNIRGAPGGPLKDRRIALKDTICLAGVPMMNGSSVMEGYTPEIDATDSHTDARRRCSHRRKGALRELLPFGRLTYRSKGPDSQSLEARLHGGRFVGRVGGAGCRWGSGYGHRRRSGGFDPYPILKLRRIWDEAHTWAHTLHRYHAYRADNRPCGAGDKHRCRQCLAPRSPRWRGWS